MKKSTSLKSRKINIIRRINRKISEYEKLGFDNAKIYNDFILALKFTKGIKVNRRADGTYYISQSSAQKISLKKLENLNKFKSVAFEIKKAGGKEKYAEKIRNENFIDEYINEIGYDVGVELFDEFGKDLKKGLKNKYTKEELNALINELMKKVDELPRVNPFG